MDYRNITSKLFIIFLFFTKTETLVFVIFFIEKSKCAPRSIFRVGSGAFVAKSGGARVSPAALAARRASYQPRPRATETEHAADMATTRMD